MQKRHRRHLHTKGRRTHFDRVIQAHPEQFTNEILVVVATKQEALDYESKFAEHFHTMYPRGLNHYAGGNAKILSQEARDNLRRVRMFGPNAKQQNKKIADALRGQPHTEERKANMRASLVGRKLSQEHRERLKIAFRKAWAARQVPTSTLFLLRTVFLFSSNEVAYFVNLHKSSVPRRLADIQAQK